MSPRMQAPREQRPWAMRCWCSTRSDGTLLKTLPTAKSVAAPVAVIDTDFDGYADRGYVVDHGCQCVPHRFRNRRRRWRSGQLDDHHDRSARGRIEHHASSFYEPDVVLTQRFAALMIGSGNRERPLLASTNDRFYTLFDYKTGQGAPTAAVVMDASLPAASASFTLTGSVPGCYYAMATSGEKVVTSSVSTGGYSYFSTNQTVAARAGLLRVESGDREEPTACHCSAARRTRLSSPEVACRLRRSSAMWKSRLPPTQSHPASTRMVPFIIGGFNQRFALGHRRIARAGQGRPDAPPRVLVHQQRTVIGVAVNKFTLRQGRSRLAAPSGAFDHRASGRHVPSAPGPRTRCPVSPGRTRSGTRRTERSRDARRSATASAPRARR